MSKASLWNMDWDKMIEERFGVDAETLSQYADAHKAGKALILPCKKGDKLFVLTTDSPDGIEETYCKKIVVVMRNGAPCAKIIAPCTIDDWGGAYRELYPEDFGSKVFDDRGVAEAMLQFRKTSIALQEKYAREAKAILSNLCSECTIKARLYN